ncbi:sensor histidine kinase [Pseudoalteromonas denitrificans]|uniref:sensor histidine kinase n=1 Tax=Pseudoalteromonas denitrificans TaxID=43656 RepID=UPI0015A6BD32|nr:ATP-binding protein [Pseudoalteromonas denitrificans]
MIESLILAKNIPHFQLLLGGKFFDINSTLLKINQDIKTVINLQKQFNNKQLESISQAIFNKTQVLHQALSNKVDFELSLAHFNALSSLIISLQQAISLHSNIRDELLLNNKNTEEYLYRNLLILLLIACSIFSYIFFAFIKAINKITNEKIKLDAKLETYSIELESEVKKRTELLLQAKEKVAESNKMAALGKVANGMAHEINSPIFEISMIAERVIRLSKKEGLANIESPMEQIINSVRHVSELIGNLLKFSRASTDDKFENVKIKNIIDDVLSLNKERFTLTSATLKVSYENDCNNTFLYCQKLQISQVLINLLNNSFDAIEMQPIKYINILVSEIKNDMFITVQDSGKGVPPQIQKNIFEPMFTSKDVGKGTGLGLSISSSIIAKHQGELYYDNQSKSCQFVIRLPKNSS